MLKTLVTVVSILAFLGSQEQSTIAPCATYTHNVNNDTLAKAETIFQKMDLFFLTSSCSDSSYLRSPFYNMPSFASSTHIDVVDEKKRK
jgi:hypothetical protein